MIPYKDDNPTTVFPFVTIGLIAVNTIAFILQIISPADALQTARSYGVIPNYLLTFKSIQPIHPVLTIFTSMFLHGGLFHLGSNMLYLWIFGDNIEDRLGHTRFIIFYLSCGIAAASSHAVTESSSMTPMIGASGAVSGILGAYLLLFPRARVRTLVFIFFYVIVVRLPALFVIGFWIVIQIINWVLSQKADTPGGVAWFAHIGGFIFGILMIKIFLKRKKHKLFF